MRPELDNKVPWVARLAYAYNAMMSGVAYQRTPPAQYMPILIDRLGYDVTHAMPADAAANMAMDYGRLGIWRNHNAIMTLLYKDMMVRRKLIDADSPLVADPAADRSVQLPVNANVQRTIDGIFEQVRLKNVVDTGNTRCLDHTGLMSVIAQLEAVASNECITDTSEFFRYLLHTPMQISQIPSVLYAKTPQGIDISSVERAARMIRLIDDARLMFQMGLMLYIVGTNTLMEDVTTTYYATSSAYAHNATFAPNVTDATLAAACLPMYDSSVFLERHAAITSLREVSRKEASSMTQAGFRYINTFFEYK